MLSFTLKLIRIANDLKSTEAAKKCGVSPTYISEIETGVKTPSFVMLKKIADAYNVSPSKLLWFEEEISEKKLNYQQGLHLILEYYVKEKKEPVNYSDADELTNKKQQVIKN